MNIQSNQPSGAKLLTDGFNNITSSTINKELRFSDFDNPSSLEQRNNCQLRPNHDFFEARISKEIDKLKDSPRSVILLNRVGDIYVAHGKHLKAVKYYTKALSVNGDDRTTVRNLIKTYLILGKPEKARDLLNFVGHDRTDDDIKHLGMIVGLVLSDFNLAETLYDKISPNYKKYYEATNTAGLVSLMSKDLEAAKNKFKKSISLNKSYAHPHNNLGVVYQEEKNNKKAAAAFKSAIETDENYVEARNNLFRLYVREGNLNMAKETILAARHLIKLDTEIQFRIGWVLMKLGEFDAAISEYEKMLEFKPENSNTLNNIGFCQASLGHTDSAISTYQRAIRGKGQNYLPIRNLMVIYADNGQKNAALRIAENILKTNPSDPFALTVVAGDLADRQKWDEAFRLLKIAYKSKPEIINLYVLLGLIYADVYPDYELGVEALEFPIKNKHPKHEEVYNNLTHIHTINDRLDKARSFVGKLSSEKPVELSTKALFELKKGNVEKAVEMYEAAQRLVGEKHVPLFVQRMNYDLGCYYQSRKKAEARKYFDKVVQEPEGINYLVDSAKERLKLLGEK